MIEYKEGRYICSHGHRHESKDDAEDCILSEELENMSICAPSWAWDLTKENK